MSEVPASLENHHSITPSASRELSGLRCGCLLPKAGMACACPAWGAAWVRSTCTRPQSRGSLHLPRCQPQVCQEWMELNVSFCTFLPIAAASRALSIQQALNTCLEIGWFIDSCIHSSQPAIAYPRPPLNFLFERLQEGKGLPHCFSTFRNLSVSQSSGMTGQESLTHGVLYQVHPRMKAPLQWAWTSFRNPGPCYL